MMKENERDRVFVIYCCVNSVILFVKCVKIGAMSLYVFRWRVYSGLKRVCSTTGVDDIDV